MTVTKEQKRLKYACYTVNLSMSIVANLPPVLLMTFRNLYGISYSMLGLLVFINYVTQLGIDLVFSFFSARFNIPKTVKTMPYLTFIGLGIYAVYPVLFPHSAYVGLFFGTIIFSCSAGLGEVLISPIIASIPADDPDREMSKLHSVYAWGVIPVIVVTTVYLMIFGNSAWYWLVFFYMLLPVVSICLFTKADIPPMKSEQNLSGVFGFLKDRTVWLFVFAIFLGGFSECTMAQWSSGYLEKSLGIPKVYGDVFGVAAFAFMLGLGRSLYGKKGTNIIKVLIMGSFGAFLCYFAAAISPYPLVGLVACGLTGLCTSMLWPGSLVVASDRFKSAGVMIYALMAAGGDFGASVGPQLIGIITDAAMTNDFMLYISDTLSLTAEQFGMKIGLAISMFIPLTAVFVFMKIKKIRNT